MDEHGEAPLLQLRVRLEKPEIYACLMRGTRRAGRLRNGIQSALLLLVAVNCVAAFVLDEKKDPAPLGIAAVALLVLAAIWITPPFRMKHEAGLLAERGDEIHLALYAEEAVFGRKRQSAVSYGECRATADDALLVLEIGGELIGIPRRATDDRGWTLLMEKFRPEIKKSNDKFRATPRIH